MDKAQVKSIVESHGWQRVETDEEILEGLDFITLVKKVGLTSHIVMSQCMHCVAMVIPEPTLQTTHMLWHKSIS